MNPYFYVNVNRVFGGGQMSTSVKKDEIHIFLEAKYRNAKKTPYGRNHIKKCIFSALPIK